MITTTRRAIAALGATLVLAGSLAACGSEPSEAELAKGMEKMMAAEGFDRAKLKESGITDEQIDEFYTCIAKEVKPNVSSRGQKLIAEGDGESKVSDEDYKAVEKAADGCASKIIG